MAICLEIDEESIKAVVKALPNQVKQAMTLKGKYKCMDGDIFDALYVWSDIALGVNGLLCGVNKEITFDVIKHSVLYKKHPDWWKPEILSSIPNVSLVTDEEIASALQDQQDAYNSFYYKDQKEGDMHD